MAGNQQLDNNYKPITGSASLYDPVTAGFVAQQAGLTAKGTDGTVYAATNATLSVTPPGIAQKANNVSTGSVASLAKAFGSNNQAGNTIIVVCGCGNGTAMTVADTLGNTYTQAATAAVSTTFEASIFYAVNIVGGANTVTVTNAGTAASMAMEIYEAYGVLAQVVAQPDQSSSGTSSGGSTTASTSALAASAPNSLAFLGVSIGTAAQNITVTTGTNWTADGGTNGLVPTTPAGLYQFNSFSQALSNTTPVVPKATIGSSEPWAAAAAIFKPATVGMSGTVTIGGYNYTNITLAAPTTTLVKTGAGVLHAIAVNTAPASGGTLEIDDALTHTTPKVGTLTSPAQGTLYYDVAFSTGLTIYTATQAGDYTIIWK